MGNLYLLISDSEPLLNKEFKKIYSELNYQAQDMVEISEWSDGVANIPSLFSIPFIHLKLTNDNEAKKFVDFFTNKKNKQVFEKPDWTGNLTIITYKKGKHSTKIKNFIEKQNGEVKIFADKDVKSIKETELKKYNLQKHIYDFLIDYIGDDVNLVFPIINTLDKLELTEIQNLDIMNLYSVLPSKPGSIPPWDLMSAIFNGDIQGIKRNYDRVSKNTYPLVIVALLKTKVSNFMKYRFYSALSGLNENEIAKEMGMKNSYALIDFKKNKNLPNKRVITLVNLVNQLENNLKGGGNPPEINEYVRTQLITMGLIIKGVL